MHDSDRHDPRRQHDYHTNLNQATLRGAHFPRMIYNVHFLRVVAALAVVYYHIASEAGLNLPRPFGKFGVDLFFVVSGFIIAYIGSKSPDSFLLRRVIRIVPFYWTASLFVFSIAWLFPQQLRQTQADVPHLLYSLFFIPHETAYSGMFPTLILGWTLNYEMYFYVLFAIALAFSRRFAPIICSVFLTLIVLAIDLSGTQNKSLKFYASPIVFEFIFGIFVYYAISFIVRRADDYRPAAWFKWLLYASTLAASVFMVVQGINGGFRLLRPIACGLPALFIVMGAILIEKLYNVYTKNKLLLLLGEASYILYLIHTYIIYGVLRLFVGPTSGIGPVTIGLLVFALMVLPSAAALVIHVWFEKPTMSYLRRALIPIPDESHRLQTMPHALEPVSSR
jgi:exopolysaccharide production protein ExoZ